VAQPAVIKLSTSETTISLNPAPNAPRLLALNSERNQAAEKLIDHVEANGRTMPLRWQLRSSDTSADQKAVQFTYDCVNPHLRLVWEWRARAASGPIEHTIRIQNLSQAELWLPLQDSFQFQFTVAAQAPLWQFWVEKGASSPSAEGTHHLAFDMGAQWTGTSSTYAHPKKGEQREMIPYSLIEHADGSGWYTGIEFSGRTRISLRRTREALGGETGLNPNPGPYRTRLLPGQEWETPTIFVGAFEGGPDGAANVLRRWIRVTLNNPLTLKNPEYPLLVSNSWGSGMAIHEQQAHSMIRDARALGLEMFHLDAGWFRSIGDWTSDPAKFPDGVASVADFAHKLGLKFGLWTDWTQVGFNARDPQFHDWLTVEPPPGWRPHDFKGITIDIGLPAAREWAAATVAKIVSEFHIDMLEHDGYVVAQGCARQDHPHAPLYLSTATRFQDEDFLWVSGANDTDVSDYATRAYYQVQAGLRRRFPGLLFEICNDGGRMVDFGSAAHGDYFSITDAYDPLSNREAFYDASYVLPPAMLETYVEKWPAPHIENFRYMLRSGLMGWFSLMQDSNAWTPEQHAAARAEFALYKNKLRPLIRSADLYHVSNRPDGVHWDGIEYFDPARQNGALMAFRGSTQDESSHTYKLKGLSPRQSYKVTYQDGSSASYIASAHDLMTQGATVQEATPDSSEIVFFQKVSAPLQR
jgi:hypothetical protein